VRRERAVGGCRDGEKRQSLRLCPSGEYRGRTKARPGTASALRPKAAVRLEVQVKRQWVRRTGPSGRKMLRRPPLPSNVMNEASGEATFN